MLSFYCIDIRYMKEAAWAKSSSTKKSSIMNEATWAKSSSEEERLNQLRYGKA